MSANQAAASDPIHLVCGHCDAVVRVPPEFIMSAAGSLLQSGSIDGFWLYTTGEAATPPWIAEASLAADWAAVNPSAE